MAVLHRALVSWFLTLVFLVLLVLRLDGRTEWNWFIVLVPLWLFDCVLLLYTLLVMVWPCRGAPADRWRQLPAHLATLVAVALKLTFQVCLCVRLEHRRSRLPLCVVFAPLIVLLAAFTFTLTRSLRRPHSAASDSAAAVRSSSASSQPHRMSAS